MSTRETYARCGPAKAEEDPREQQLRIDILGLDEDEEREADDGVPNDTDEARADDVRQQTPCRTGRESDELVHEAQRAHEIADTPLDADDVGDHERDGGVEEDEEGYREETDAQEVGCRLDRDDAAAAAAAGAGGRRRGHDDMVDRDA